MKSFREHLSEEVVPTALSGGTIDINNPAVRAEINGILAAINSRSCITPYVALTKIRKALSYFHIELPGKSYMQGDHGVEVWEIHQFGHKMGMTNDGEFVKDVPCKYYLFFHYHLFGSMFMVDARVLDKEGLDKRLSAVEDMIKEDAAAQQAIAKATAPKEPLPDLDASKSQSTKDGVAISMRRKDKKLSADKLDEGYASIGRPFDWAGDVNHKARFYGKKPKETDTKKDEKDDTYKDSKQGGKVKFAKTVKEGRMPASIIRHKQKLANMTPEEKAKKFAGKSEEQLKSMARRHGYGKDSTEYSKHLTKEETLDEGFDKIIKGVKRSLKGWPAQPLHGEGGKKPKDVVKRTRGRSDADIKNLASDSNKAAEHSPAGLQKNVAKQEMKRRKLDEEVG